LANFDLALVGNVGRNTLHRFDGTAEPILGGPIVQAALATSWSDKKVAVVTRMNPADDDLLDALKQAKIPVFVSRTAETTRSHIYYQSEDVEDRRLCFERYAGGFSLVDLAGVDARVTHLVGINRLEFSLKFMEELSAKGMPFSVDMQALVRDADVGTGEVTYRDYPHKKDVAAMAQMIKLDVMEAHLLTGSRDLETAATQFERWGAAEVMVTASQGALVRHGGRSYFEPFTNRNNSGRTGRGDTVFSSYLVRRFGYGVADSLKFAAALCSFKMETPGPFTGTLEQVLARMRETASA
jgi:sugar/nucleoside kinase (ribokinase family)